MLLSEKIAHLRKRQGWSQEELAERMGVSRQSVSKWESGASVPELDRIIQLCDLFGISADALIRPDSIPAETEDALAPELDDDELPVLTLDDVYDYIAHCRTAIEKVAMGVAACVASPAPLLLLIGLFGDNPGPAIGVPLLLLMVAWAVYQFVLATSEMRKYAHIEKGRFRTARGVRSWIRNSREQFHTVLVREISIGVGLCIVSPGPLIFFSSFFGDSDFGAGLGTAVLLCMVGAGVFLFVRSGCVQTCYKRLLKQK